MCVCVCVCVCCVCIQVLVCVCKVCECDMCSRKETQRLIARKNIIGSSKLLIIFAESGHTDGRGSMANHSVRIFHLGILINVPLTGSNLRGSPAIHLDLHFFIILQLLGRFFSNKLYFLLWIIHFIESDNQFLCISQNNYISEAPSNTELNYAFNIKHIGNTDI